METVKLTMAEGKLNTDDSPYVFPITDFINSVNFRAKTSKTINQAGAGQGIGSNQLFSASDTILSSIPGNFTVVGEYESLSHHSIFYILYNDQNNFLVVGSNLQTGTCTIILDNRKFYINSDNGYSGLNLIKYPVITGIGMVGDILAWTDNLNDIRRVNVTRNYSSFTVSNFASPLISDDVINLIRRPPDYPLVWNKYNAASLGITNNSDFISNNAFQFMYRYVYLDNEQSVLSPYSLIANYNYATTGKPLDMITIQIPYSELIPVDVLQVDICMRYANGTNFSVIKSWNINTPADLVAINQHNSGVQNLKFNFFNNQNGLPLDAAYSVKPFDSVPNISKCLEAAKNRFFINNYTEGYNAPATTSLTLSLVPDTVTKQNAVCTWWQVVWKHNLVLHSADVLYVPQAPNPGYYYYASYSAGGPFPSALNISDGVFYGTDFHSVVSSYVNGNFSGVSLRSFGPETRWPPDTTTLNDIFTIASNKNELKSNSKWKLGIVFYDRYLRNCGVLSNDGLNISTPAWGYGTTNLFQGIQWNLSNSNAVNEIPAFASFYSIVRTKNLAYTSFVQGYAHTVAYYSGNGTSTPYTFVYDVYKAAPAYAGIAVDISLLDNSGLGYTFQKGDLLNLYNSGTPPFFGMTQPLYQLSVIGQYGQWVLCQLENIGTLGQAPSTPTAYDALYFEIYTPYYPSVSEPFYEVGNMYAVIDPGTATRQYSTLQGMLEGDIYLLSRVKSNNQSDYVAEAMSPNDKFFLNWNTDIGRPNLVIQQPGILNNKYGVRYSNEFVQNTKINGLSSFDALNEVDLPADYGEPVKLQLTSKMQELGDIMLALCTEGVLSLYLGESQLLQQQSDAFVAGITNVIGTINPLKGGYGCIHPESVRERNGRVYYYSIKKGAVIRYSVDGLIPIQNYKLSSFLYNRSIALLAMINAGQQINVLGMYDEYNEEYGLFLPATSSQPAAVLPDIVLNSYTFNF